jgi:DDE superfamily endonuclease
MGVYMVIGKPLLFVTAFVSAINAAMEEHHPGRGLSALQRTWLAFCVTAILVTNSVCWARFERAGLGTYSLAGLSWMFRHAKIPWELLLVASVRMLLRHYGITHGCLVIDDTDTQRAKAAKKIAFLHTLRDKTSGGCIWGQSLVFLLFVTPKITLPLGFAFYLPAPELTAWYKQERVRKQQGLPRRSAPPKPPPNPQYPTKQDLALRLLAQCPAQYPDLTVQCVVADALYGTATFLDTAAALFNGVQVISQLRSNQKVRVYKREEHVADYFATHPGTPQQIRIRGGDHVPVIVGSARLYVCAHRTKRFIIALKYEAEDTYRYLIASELSWRTLDIVQAYTLRWLVEVFVQDWKAYEGWGTLTKQPGEEGSRRSLILSLLADHCLLLHPAQHAQLKNNLPAYTVGSLRAEVQVECLVDVLQQLVWSDDPQAQLDRLCTALHEAFVLDRSKKHLVQRQLGRLEPTPYLKYRAHEVMRRMPVLST